MILCEQHNCNAPAELPVVTEKKLVSLLGNGSFVGSLFLFVFCTSTALRRLLMECLRCDTVVMQRQFHC